MMETRTGYRIFYSKGCSTNITKFAILLHWEHTFTFRRLGTERWYGDNELRRHERQWKAEGVFQEL